MKKLTITDLHGVTTAEEYRRAQVKWMAANRRGVPQRNTDAKPTVVLEADGGYRFRCECGQYPAVDPVSLIACCFNCGLVYRDLTLPEDSD